MTKKAKQEVAPAEPVEPTKAKAATRRGFQTCCCTCVRAAWCRKNATKGRQPCTAARRSSECLGLIQMKWCTVCTMHAGQSEMEDPDQMKFFQQQEEAPPAGS
jgi:hypothetical protein